MSPAEIPYRLRRAAAEKIGRFRNWPEAKQVPLDSVWNGSCDPEIFRQNRISFPPCPDFYSGGTNDAQLASCPDAWKQACLEEAEHYLKHEYSFFAFENHPYGDVMDWNRDDSTGKTVEQGYAPDIDFRDAEKVGDVKYVWELARLQHLVRLAQAWRYSRDGRFATEIVAQITDFILRVPYMQNIHWTSGIEVGLRLISMTWAFHLIRDYPGLTANFCSLLVRSVDQHLAFIDRHYSAYSSANNHLVAEASGVYFAASYWKNLKKSNHYRTCAKKRLVEEITKQVFSDGVSKEQTFGYSFFVWDLWLIPALIGDASGDSFPEHYWERLKRMAVFLDCVSDRNGNTPNVGDEDGGYAVLLEPRSIKPVASLRCCAGGNGEVTEKMFWMGESLQTSDFRLPEDCRLEAGDCREEDSELTSKASGLKPQALSEVRIPKPEASLFCFTEGGYYVVKHITENVAGRSKAAPFPDEILLLFDAGSLGYPSTAVHGHADALSLWLHVNGQPILVDPGTFSYQDTPDRRYYRSTSQHNTLAFGNNNQAEYVNRFIWGRKPKIQILQAGRQGDQIVLDAEVTWFSDQRHRRQICFDLATLQLTVTDDWQGDVPPVIRFHFHPVLTPVLTGCCAGGTKGVCVIVTPEMQLRIDNPECDCELETYQYSPACYQKNDAIRLRCQTKSNVGEFKTYLLQDPHS